MFQSVPDEDMVNVPLSASAQETLGTEIGLFSPDFKKENAKSPSEKRMAVKAKRSRFIREYQ